MVAQRERSLEPNVGTGRRRFCGHCRGTLAVGAFPASRDRYSSGREGAGLIRPQTSAAVMTINSVATRRGNGGGEEGGFISDRGGDEEDRSFVGPVRRSATTVRAPRPG